MNKVIIITDSTNDLNVKMLKQKKIVVLPLYVNFTDVSYLDGVEITTPELYQLVDKKHELPKTAAIPVTTFVEVFKKYIEEGNDIVFSGISKAMSRTYENAVLGAKEVCEDRIHIVDSKNLSTGIGLLLLKACKYRDAGDDAKTIAEKLCIDREKVLSQFVIETMDYLHKGGRCSSITKLVGSLLKIKPMIAVRDGKMHVAKKPHGKMKVALDELLKQIQSDVDCLDQDCVIVTHSLAFDYCDYLVAELSKIIPNIPVYQTVAGCVISSHCGQGTIGILYMTK